MLTTLFFGSAGFGLPVLEVLKARTRLLGVVSTKEARQGRGLNFSPSPVKRAAVKLGLACWEPEDPNGEGFVGLVRELGPELIVLAAYRFILKPGLLGVPSKGGLNVHPSLLPKYRGPAPIERAIMSGEETTGVSLFLMNESIDSGDLVAQERVRLGPDETAGELASRLAQVGAELLERTLPAVEQGFCSPIPQDPAQATYAPKIDKRERLIDWSQDATRIHNLVRALAPTPGAYTFFRGDRLAILRTARLDADNLGPGRLIPGKRLLCGTGQGTVELSLVRPAGGRIMKGSEFSNGRRISAGERLG
ncbi:MAG: methionyl-tRNA formyltransferase [candidate division WOR-3 bacterium]